MGTDLREIQRNLRRLHQELRGRKRVDEKEPDIAGGDALEMNPLTQPPDDD